MLEYTDKVFQGLEYLLEYTATSSTSPATAKNLYADAVKL